MLMNRALVGTSWDLSHLDVKLIDPTLKTPADVTNPKTKTGYYLFLDNDIDKLAFKVVVCYLMNNPADLYQFQFNLMQSLVKTPYMFKWNLMPIHSREEWTRLFDPIPIEVMDDFVGKSLDMSLAMNWMPILSNAVQGVPLSEHQCSVLQDGLGTFKDVASADPHDLMDCSLDKNTAKRVHAFFH